MEEKSCVYMKLGCHYFPSEVHSTNHVTEIARRIRAFLKRHLFEKICSVDRSYSRISNDDVRWTITR